ncbi:MAG: aminodeoxychorismate/anthranilate synthase component II [Candidatus Omnitrophica bacterium]|nr:aminodeoxychorismate/anthranilate synthase component II [Candidatus Omnitrophota bacterium]MDD5429535.1 aminodeoxychorismate/anthranilate synthase component II [Candidatus Omnitrophota bacterium]
MRVLVIDNYDSFTYNLVQYLQELGADTFVYRNDAIAVKDLKTKKFDRIVISPGPGRPQDAGISIKVIDAFHKSIPILGVCLGHQCIGYFLGGCIVRAGKIMHGKTSLIHHDGNQIFKGVKNPFEATRYHSLVIKPESLLKTLTVNAKTDDGIIMGIKMKEFPVFGVQFHPESILTKEGKKILKNFLNLEFKKPGRSKKER